MRVLVLSHRDVLAALPPSACAEVMATVLAEHARGETYMPLRSVMMPPDAAGFMGLMPGWRGPQHGTAAAFGLKAVCIMPGNPARGLDAHQGLVTLFDGQSGQPTAILDAAAITEIRTAAVTAVATSVLARQEARVLAILGAGTQARAHLRALLHVRDFEQVRIYAPTRAHARALAEEAGGVRADQGNARAGQGNARAGQGNARAEPGNSPAEANGAHAEPVNARAELSVAVALSAQEALRDADVVVTATSSREPVLRRDWLKPGAHVNAVGASSPTAREIDTATVAASALFCDSRESVRHEAGEFQLAVKEGLIAGPEHIRAELGEVLAGTAPGRRDDSELTLFRSLGLAIEDLAAAERAVATATELSIGTAVEL
jgi:ornithine cyclodeaminase/alanine dehydrogenase-like protein (mu-crystallin family)